MSSIRTANWHLSALGLAPCMLSFCCAAALAQPVDVVQDDAQKENKDAPPTLEAVRVSASSRIDRPGFSAPTPTMHLSNEELSVDSRPNVAAALNDIPQFRATTSPQTTGTNTGAGIAALDLRGLGISRTLVLEDGRRISSDNDLNTIPSIMVRNVDVVTGGASAAWGSGAVGGVVNLGIDDTFTGFKGDVHGGLSSRNDDAENAVALMFGTDFSSGRGHLVVGGDYYNSRGIIPKNSRSTIGRWATVSNGDGTYTMRPDVGFSNAAYGGLITSGVLAGKAFNSDGSLRDFDAGTVVGTSSIGGESPSNDDLSPLTTPQKKYAILARATYDLTDTVKLTAELRNSRMWNNYIWFGDNSRGSSAINISADNAYLSDAVREALAAAGESSFTLGRFNNDLSYSSIDFERKTTQATLALDGSFGEHWRWSGYYSHGEYRVNMKTPGFLLTDNFANAVDSVIDPSSGQAVCRTALTNPNTNCVPINLFGEGSPSQAAIDYVTGTPEMHATTRLDTAGVSLRGEPFELPAGAVSVATGLEYRREYIRQTVGELDAEKAFTTFSFSPMRGGYNVKEAFAEVLVPVLKDKVFFNDLQLNLAGRVSDYSTTGSIWSWKFGFTNEFFSGFRGRFTRSRDIRSANLSEMYTQTTTGYNNVVDPVTNTTVYALTNGGGNTSLTPETAYTTTYGFTWSPTRVAGLDMSLDYFDINIENVITTVSAQDILTRCYEGNADMCSRVTRDADGNVQRIVSSYVNLADYHTDGIDAEVAYLFPLSRFSNLPGALRLRLLGTWVHSLTTDDGVSKIEYLTSQGYSFGLGVPRWRANAMVSYQNSTWGADLRVRYISAGNYNTTVNITNNAIPAYTYYDLGFNYQLPTSKGPAVQLYATVNNVLNKQAPDGSLYSPYYDVVGRYCSLGVRFNF